MNTLGQQVLSLLASDEGEEDEENAMIGDVERLRMTEAELARNLHAVLRKVEEGVEVIVEEGSRAVAVIKAPNRSGRPITEILQEARQRNSTVTLDDDFGADLEEVISRHQREPWNPPSWD